MIYFFLEIHMENQINADVQNTQQIGQNPVNQPVLSPEKPKTNYLVIGVVILVCFVLFGFGGYFLGKRSSNSLQSSNLDQSQPTPTGIYQTSNPTTNPSPTSTGVVIPGWKSYINTKNRYSLQYPNSLELVKGPGANLPDEEFQKLDNVSFSGMQKSGDSNAGVVFGITVNPQDANGKAIQCITNDECLQKWVNVLNISAHQVSYINKTIMGKNIKGFEYQNKNSLYTQTNQYFIYPESNNVWQVSLTMNNYTAAEVAGIFNQILSTFKLIN